MSGTAYQSLINEYINETGGSSVTRAALEKIEFVDVTDKATTSALDENGDPILNTEWCEHLDAGKILTIVYPTTSQINELLDGLGVEPDYYRPEDSVTDYLELYSIAQRSVDSEDEVFSFYILDIDNVTLSSDDLEVITPSSSDNNMRGTSNDLVESGDSDITVADFSAADFNKARVKSLFDWAVILETEPSSLFVTDSDDTEATASAAVTIAAASDGKLTDIAKSEGPDTINADTGNKKIDFPLDLLRRKPYYNGTTWTSFNTDRRTRLKYDVYSIHSFEKNRDYYLIRAHATTNTENQFQSVLNREASAFFGQIIPFEGLADPQARLMFGFTRRLIFNHYIEQDTGNGDVQIIGFIPKNKASSQTTTDTLSQNFGGKVGINGTTPVGEFNMSIGYSSSISNTVTGEQIATHHNGDKQKRANASWEYIFDWPKRGKEVGGFLTHVTRCYEELEAWPSAKSAATQMEWIYEIKPDIWSRAKDKKYLTVNSEFTFSDGLAQGRFARRASTYLGAPVQTEVDKQTVKRTFGLKRPIHLAVRPSTFAPSAGGKALDKNAGNGTIKVLSESKWKVESNVNWVSGFTPASGDKTGGTEVAVSFKYDTNSTGNPRTGKITLSNEEGDKIEIQINQGAN